MKKQLNKKQSKEDRSLLTEKTNEDFNKKEPRKSDFKKKKPAPKTLKEKNKD
jgi:hypothetical protein